MQVTSPFENDLYTAYLKLGQTNNKNLKNGLFGQPFQNLEESFILMLLNEWLTYFEILSVEQLMNFMRLNWFVQDNRRTSRT